MSTISKPVISFENTQNAFAYKTDRELKRAEFLFNSMGYQWLVNMGTRITPWAIKAGLPIKGIIRSTIFRQFVGGESLEDTKFVADVLGKYGVSVILDYGVEGGDDGEEGFDHSMEEFLKIRGFSMFVKFKNILDTYFRAYNTWIYNNEVEKYEKFE